MRRGLRRGSALEVDIFCLDAPDDFFARAGAVEDRAHGDIEDFAAIDDRVAHGEITRKHSVVLVELRGRHAREVGCAAGSAVVKLGFEGDERGLLGDPGVGGGGEEFLLPGDAGVDFCLARREEVDEAAGFGGLPDDIPGPQDGKASMVGRVGIGGRFGAIWKLDFAAARAHGVDIAAKVEKPSALNRVRAEVVLQGGVLAFGFAVKIALKLVPLMGAMDELDGLFKADGDEQADDDGGDVDEEVSPGAGGVLGWVDVENKTECRG